MANETGAMELLHWQEKCRRLGHILQSFHDAYKDGEISITIEGDKFDIHLWLKSVALEMQSEGA